MCGKYKYITLYFTVFDIMCSLCLFQCRFLATGDSYPKIAGSFRVGVSTVSRIVPDVATAIWDCLVDEFMAVLLKLICQ